MGTVTEIAYIQKYGNLVLSISGTELQDQGFAYGDIVTVHVGDQDFLMPIASDYSDVDQGEMVLRMQVQEDLDLDFVVVAVNMGDFATQAGIATRSIMEEAPGYLWTYSEDLEQPVSVSIEMNEAGGYYDQWLMRQLVRTNHREDYEGLSDAEYANFREITAGNIGAGKLYRSSSPINPSLNRNQEADAAAREARINTVLNLADFTEDMASYEGYQDSYYATLDVMALNLGIDSKDPEFQRSLADGIRFLNSGETPFLIHCNEGKDRSGFVCAILECLMGATLDEVVDDYMLTYYNYYSVEMGSEQWEAIARSNVLKILSSTFQEEELTDDILAISAEEYLESIGVSVEDIVGLKTRLEEEE
ncbi:MAG: tyrosine-protein phosphatase [Clostridia bacterium]|nr:tyrosine-protein phosphatase [Clostridia bacterium]